MRKRTPKKGPEEPVSTAKRTTAEKRAEVVRQLLMPFPESDVKIAAQCGVSRNSVAKWKAEVKAQGVDVVFTDGRKSNGPKTIYTAAYARIEELKRAKAECGGRDLWTILVREEGWRPEEVPCISSIDRYLSTNGLVMPREKGKFGNKGEFYLYDKIETVHDLACMDEVFPFRYASGRLKVCDIRDAHSGAVYAEPFSYDFTAKDQRGINPTEAAGVFLLYCQLMGTPRRLRLDNGCGSIISSSWLSELVRHAISLGTIVEWEPPAAPTGNSPVERWHRELQKAWRMNYGDTLRSSDKAFALIRELAWKETFWKPRRSLGNKASAEAFPIQSWNPGDASHPYEKPEPIGKGGNTRQGELRMHRMVQSNGIVMLHGDEFIRLSDQRTGCKVRVDFVVEPGGGGIGSIIDSKGEVCMTFRHKIEQGTKQGERLTYDHKEYGATGGEDVRTHVWSQAAHDHTTATASKQSKPTAAQMVIRQAADTLPDGQ